MKPNNPEYQKLIVELNQTLQALTDDSGESSFNVEQYHSKQDCIIVAYKDGQPVGTGSIRYLSNSRCEIKRMYAKEPGVGKHLVAELETQAVSLGYSEVVLSTRRINDRAIKIYRKLKFIETEGYGKYAGVERSVCMKKILPLP